ncbi:alpha/beta fold hydrolase [Gallaecimonas mangrovi]|uniref:alpha/beta fold hydrolase n=1 Tax=Gallaecimonas mangrovi TaxID=2291597 RepID=UPI000E1FED1E|nr:alpha/beta fold hydrolase [Gallaecimonas mangrovi]
MLNYQQRGQGPDVILIHGLFGSLDNLGNLARSLEDAFCVTSVDLRNHGKSFHTDDTSLTAMAGDIIALMDALNLKSASLVGHSLGGKVAMQVALSNANRVNKLVVADIAPVTYQHRHHDNVFEALTKVDVSQYQSRKDVEDAISPYIEEQGTRLFILKNLVKDGDGFRWRINVPVLLEHYQQVLQAPTGEPFTDPTLFIKGGNSPYLTEAHSQAVGERFPKAQLKVISGVGHWLHAEKPAVFNKLVRDFLS